MNFGENFFNWIFPQLKWCVAVLFLIGLVICIKKQQVSLLITYVVLGIAVCAFIFFPMEIMEAFGNIGGKIVGASITMPSNNTVTFVDTRILRSLFSMRTFM